MDRLSRLFFSYTAQRVWAVIGMLWTGLAAALAVFAAAAVLWSYVTRTETAYPPPATETFGAASGPVAWVEAAAPPGVGVDVTLIGGPVGAHVPDRDGAPAGAWHTVRLRGVNLWQIHRVTIDGPADREAFGEALGVAVREALEAWEPGVTIAPLPDPRQPVNSNSPGIAEDADAWGLRFAAERPGGTHEGVVRWYYNSRRSRGPPFELTVVLSEDRWGRR